MNAVARTRGRPNVARFPTPCRDFISPPRSTTPMARRTSATPTRRCLTDVVARFRRLMGDDVYFLTGVDEHGQKVQQSARAARHRAAAVCRRDRRRLPGVVHGAGDFQRRLHPHHRGPAQAGRARDPATPLRPGRNLSGLVPGLLQHAAGAVSPGEGSRAGRLVARAVRRGHRDHGDELFLQAARLPGVADRLPEDARGLRLPTLPAEAGARISLGAVERPVHLAPA